MAVKDAAHRAPLPENAGGRVIPFRDPSAADLDDATVVCFLLDGDARAPRIVWQRLAPMVRGMLRRAFGPEHDVEDLAQEVFLVLFRRIATLREPQALRAFVISITAHTIRREVRRKTAMRWLRWEAVPVIAARDADLDSREALVRLYRILDRLSIDDRTVFTLRFLEGLELLEVAQAMGLSVATTKRRIAHAWTRVAYHAQRDAALIGYLSRCPPPEAP